MKAIEDLLERNPIDNDGTRAVLGGNQADQPRRYAPCAIDRGSQLRALVGGLEHALDQWLPGAPLWNARPCRTRAPQLHLTDGSAGLRYSATPTYRVPLPLPALPWRSACVR
jgi:hypothetical protein